MKIYQTEQRSGSKRRVGFSLVEIMTVVGIFAIVVAIAVPSWIRARSQSRMKTCQENLTKIDGAKEQWALETNQMPGSSPLWDDLVGSDSYLEYKVAEPSGGTYTVNAIGTNPQCNTGYPGHTLSEIGLTITELEY